MKIFGRGSHLIDKDLSVDVLMIEEGAELTAPEGKYLSLSVMGVGKKLMPGTYKGGVIISVADYCVQGVYPSVNRSKPIDMKTAVSINDNRLVAANGVPAVVWGGRVTGNSASDIYIATDDEDFAGIVVDGDSDYTINNAVMDFSGPGFNDFVGQGAGVTCIGDSKVTINNSRFKFNSITRCAVHAGGRATVFVNNCRMENLSENCEMGDWSWGIGVRGTNRLTQLADDANVYYIGCELLSNGWGILSVDGSNYAGMTVKNCYLELSGPYSHGYGIFCIGPTKVRIDHSKLNVYGYPLMLMGMEKKAVVDFVNGCEVIGRQYGIHTIGDTGSVVNIRDSSFDTGKANIVVKGATGTVYNIENSRMKSGQGVILQMMDNDDPSMGSAFIDVSMYRTMEDARVEGRDLTAVADKDVVFNISNSSLKGDFFNSTTNLREKASKQAPEGLVLRKGAKAPGALAGSMNSATDDEAGHAPPPPMADKPEGGPGGPGGMGDMADKTAPKNLGINLRAAKIKGRISSAKQLYSVDFIDETTREELCNVTQHAATPVNNGVILTLDGDSEWVPTGDCWLTSLTLEGGAQIRAPKGKTLEAIVNGTPVTLGPGSYRGLISIKIK